MDKLQFVREVKDEDLTATHMLSSAQRTSANPGLSSARNVLLRGMDYVDEQTIQQHNRSRA